MKVTSAKFVKSIIGTDEILEDGKFQVAFIGRSNVGKSTLINSLTGVNGLARSSSTPGRTTRMDFYLINKEYYYVDLPGYGYAKYFAEKREQLAQMIRWYLLDSGITNRLVVLIIDAKVGITPFDLFVLNSLKEKQIDHLLVVNKIDKLKMGQKEKILSQIKKEHEGLEIFACAIDQKQGIKELANKISFYAGKNNLKAPTLN